MMNIDMKQKQVEDSSYICKRRCIRHRTRKKMTLMCFAIKLKMMTSNWKNNPTSNLLGSFKADQELAMYFTNKKPVGFTAVYVYAYT